ncbi:MAG: hypothetical protein FWH07_01735 [Oscillospiraceae bacterium]|nr:hypothetical protein [Oscillospiraceae bacterium]
MENNNQDNKNGVSAPKPNKLLLPILALSIEVAAALLFLLGSMFQIAGGFVVLFAILLLISGFILAIAGLGNGVKEIGKPGLVLSIIAIAIPLAPVLFIIVFLIGAATGMIALM